MVGTKWAPTQYPNGEVLAAAVTELRSILPFDAVQLLRHEPNTSSLEEVMRSGYEAGSAWALSHLFTKKYRFGFTQALSPHDGLPPAISSVRQELRKEFIESPIFRDHLGANGFRDGLSMELFAGERYVGIAHFSARSETGFSHSARLAAASVRGLLAALVLQQGAQPIPSGLVSRTLSTQQAAATARSIDRDRVTSWHVIDAGAVPQPEAPGFAPAGIGSDRFYQHLADFRLTGLASMNHLWEHQRQLYRLELHRIAGSNALSIGVTSVSTASVFGLSLQELRVVSLLCVGHDDAAIAAKLRLSRRTVESHVLRARQKMAAKNRVEAVVRIATTASVLVDPAILPAVEALNVVLPADARNQRVRGIYGIPLVGE